MAMNDSHTLTVAQAAETLNVSERTVWRYLKSGRLTGQTVGSVGSQRTLITQAAVAALRSQRGHDPELEVLRAERDQLVDQLEAEREERMRLAARVERLQRALIRPEPGPVTKGLGVVLGTLERIRTVRAA
jgi:excisionase family DNA binding protein